MLRRRTPVLREYEGTVVMCFVVLQHNRTYLVYFPQLSLFRRRG